jgi:hypothetical protein
VDIEVSCRRGIHTVSVEAYWAKEMHWHASHWMNRLAGTPPIPGGTARLQYVVGYEDRDGRNNVNFCQRISRIGEDKTTSAEAQTAALGNVKASRMLRRDISTASFVSACLQTRQSDKKLQQLLEEGPLILKGLGSSMFQC